MQGLLVVHLPLDRLEKDTALAVEQIRFHVHQHPRHPSAEEVEARVVRKKNVHCGPVESLDRRVNRRVNDAPLLERIRIEGSLGFLPPSPDDRCSTAC